MEKLTSRKNELLRRVRLLGTDRAARRAAGEFAGAGRKLLREALLWGMELTAVLWDGPPTEDTGPVPAYLLPRDLLDYVSPLQNAGGVVFTARMRTWDPAPCAQALVLEGIQDPGNLGTILRTANAMGADTVVLTGACADAYNPKTVRATMGALFRQRFYELAREDLPGFLSENGLRLYGAALTPGAADLRTVSLKNAAVAVGSEGAGLSDALLALCDGTVTIPMDPACESLNAAAAAAILLWEMAR